MMIRANGSYLDYDGDLVIEKQSKLFKDISLVAGNYSYADTLPLTSNNKEILGLEMSNQDKIIYGNIPGEVLTDSGELIYIGSIRIDSIVGDVINFTFLSGNSDWINLLGNDPILNNTANLNLIDYEVITNFEFDVTEANYIVARMGKLNGIVFPLVDNGVLSTRGFRRLRPKDLQPFIYLKNVMDGIFNQCGLKLTGPLLNDYLYSHAIISGNNIAVLDKQIINRRVFSGLSTDQVVAPGTPTINLATGFASPVNVNVIYTNSKNSNFNSTTHKYQPDVRMNLFVHGTIAVKTGLNNTIQEIIYKNGVVMQSETRGVYAAIPINTLTFGHNILCEAGDLIEVRLAVGGVALTVLAGYTEVYFEAAKIYHIYPAQLIKSMQFSEFVGEVFRMFNVVPSYNQFNKTITAELFKNIKHNPEVDISPYVESIDQRFSEDVINYAKTSSLKFSESSLTEITDYNKLNPIPYGGNTISINNFYLDRIKDVIVLNNFVAPFTYFNTVFGCWMPKLKYFTLSQYQLMHTTGGVPGAVSQPIAIASTSDNPQNVGTALFNPSDAAAKFQATYIIRPNTGIFSYNFDWCPFITAVDPQGQNIDADFKTNSTGTYQVMDHAHDSDEMVMLTFLPGIYVNTFSTFDGVYFGVDFLSPNDSPYYKIFDLAYFLPPPNMGLQLSHAFGFPDGFTGINSKDNYYRETGEILNDPVKYTARCYLPEKIFRTLDPTLPVRIKTKEHNSLCYLNRITGYKGSLIPCDVELMKF